MSTRLTTRHGVEEVVAEIRNRQRFLVTSHARPDGDAVGGMLGCVHLLRALGKQAEPMLSDPVPYIYQCLPGAEEVSRGPVVPEKYDAAIILECDSLQRTRLAGLEGMFTINLDHHNSARDYANVNWIDPNASAAAELVYRVARVMEVPLSPEMATCLYTAVLTDTGSFCYIGTNENTFELARDLVAYGADPVSIAQCVYFSNPAAKMRLLGCALQTLQQDGDVAWLHVTRADIERSNAAEEDAEGIVNYALGIDGVEVAVFFREMPGGRFRVSLRSKGNVNVARVAEKFGGGGHDCASGHPVDGPLAHAVAEVMSTLRGQRSAHK